MKLDRIFLVAALPLLVLAGCFGGDDDPTAPDGGGDGDTTPPVVFSVDPESGDAGVGLDQDVVVVFSEPMDPTSDDGAITLSTGGAAATWTDDRTLAIDHPTFPEGTEVTLAIGAALADVAGNTLAAPFTTSFYTQSSSLVLLDSTPADAAAGVDRNASIVLVFSEPMNLSSIAPNVTIDDGTAARRVPVTFSVDAMDDNVVVLDPDATLPASQSITVTVGANVQAAFSGQTLGEDAAIQFTTGVTADETPPQLVGITPPSGSVIPSGTPALVFEFSEAIDPSSFEPSRIGAQFELFIDALDVEPTWSNDGATLTLPLPATVPPGLSVYVEFDGFSDLAGNVGPGFEYRSVFAGTADPWPFEDGAARIVMGESTFDDGVETSTGQYTDTIVGEDQGGGVFRFVAYDLERTTPSYYDEYARDADSIDFVGFADADSGVFGPRVELSPPPEFLRLPVAVGSWNGTTSATEDGQTINVIYTVRVLEQLDVPAYLMSFDQRKGSRGPEYVWTDTWKTVLEYAFQAGGETVQAGVDTTYYAPGIGEVRAVSFEEDLMEGTTNTSVETTVGIAPPN